MPQLMFYHLTRSPVEQTAALLLGRARLAGWHVMLRGTAQSSLATLNRKLWQAAPPASFLAHGMQGGAQDADQPILLGTGPATNNPCALMLVDGAEPLAGEAETMERVWILFNGGDDAAMQTARGQWKALTARGLPAQYWSEESGAWQKKAESAGV